MTVQVTIVDAVTLVTSIVGTVFGLQTAAIWGPYIAILCAALFGASCAISFARGPSMTGGQSARWIGSAVLGSLLFTVSIAQLILGGLHRFVQFDVSLNVLLLLVAVTISASRDYWVSGAAWLWNEIKSRVSKQPNKGDHDGA